MGFLWDIIQSSQISKQAETASSLQTRVRWLEHRLQETQEVLCLLLQGLGTHMPTLHQGSPSEPFFSKVIGVGHKNPDGSDRQEIIKSCHVGEQLTLVRVNKGPQSPSTIALSRQSGERLGFLPPDLADSLALSLDLGARIDVEITKITGGDSWFFRKPRRVRVKIIRYGFCLETSRAGKRIA